jgi:hypothetical protein
MPTPPPGALCRAACLASLAGTGKKKRKKNRTGIGRWVCIYFFALKAPESRGKVLLILYYSQSYFWSKADVTFGLFG